MPIARKHAHFALAILLVLAALLASSVALLRPAHARAMGSVAAASLEPMVVELVSESERVVRGAVVAQRSFQENGSGPIWTEQVVSVHYTLLGEAGSEVIVRTKGGKLADGGLAFAVTHEPVFRVGEEVILFLTHDGSDWRPALSDMGKFIVLGDRVIHPASEGAMALDGFVGLVESTLANQQKPSALPSDWRSREPDKEMTVEIAPEDFVFRGVRWAGSSPVIPYRIHVNTLQADLDDGSTDDFRRAIIQAADVWSNVPEADFTLVYDGETDVTGFEQNFVNEVMFVTDQDLSTAAIAGVWYRQSDGIIVEADIAINELLLWNAIDSPGEDEFDLQSVVLHEFGHWIALGHDTEPAAVMYPMIPSGMGSIRRELHANDIAGISYVYPCANLPCNPDAPVVTPTEPVTPTVTPTAPVTPTATITPTETPTPPTEPTEPTPSPTDVPTDEPTEPTPTATPTPTVDPTRREVTVHPATGGTIAYEDDDEGSAIHVTIPQGAVTEPVTVALQLLTPANTTFEGRQYADYSFEISVESVSEQSGGYQFGGPVYVDIHYTESRIAGIDESLLALACRRDEDDAWRACDMHDVPPEINPDENRIRAAIFESGQFALFGVKESTKAVFLPLVRK